MIEEPTCLILGAGASAPYGLPTTDELRHLMLPLTPEAAATTATFVLNHPPRGFIEPKNPQKEWYIYLNQVCESAGLTDCLKSFYAKFSGADRNIDWFLRRNESEFGDVARLHIAAALLACERNDRLRGDWYQLLSEEIIPRNLESLEEGKLSVITFNYDRSFERYFLNQFENLCNFPPAEAQAAVSKIKLEHVYGQLGTLDYVPYGNYERASTASRQIRTIRLEPDQEVQARIGKLIRESTYINFIGFGFDDENIELLGPANFKGKRVYSTTRGMSARTREKVRKLLRVRFNAKDTASLTAAELLNAKDLFGPKLPPPSAPKKTGSTRRPSNWMSGWRV